MPEKTSEMRMRWGADIKRKKEEPRMNADGHGFGSWAFLFLRFKV
jgi:hypothetical protein